MVRLVDEFIMPGIVPENGAEWNEPWPDELVEQLAAMKRLGWDRAQAASGLAGAHWFGHLVNLVKLDEPVNDASKLTDNERDSILDRISASMKKMQRAS